MNHERGVIKELQRRGFDPSEPDSVPKAVYDEVRMRVRSLGEKIVDGTKMMRARTEERLGINEVEEVWALANLAQCRKNECGSHGTLDNGDDVCHRCNCHGKDLFIKTRRANEHCPAEPPYWDNRVKLTVNNT